MHPVAQAGRPSEPFELAPAKAVACAELVQVKGRGPRHNLSPLEEDSATVVSAWESTWTTAMTSSVESDSHTPASLEEEQDMPHRPMERLASNGPTDVAAVVLAECSHGGSSFGFLMGVPQ